MLVSLVIVLIVVGVLLWAIAFLPIDTAIMQLIRAVVVIFAVLYVLRVLFPGALSNLP